MKKTALLVLLLWSCGVNAQVYQARDLSIGAGMGAQSVSYDISDTAGYRDHIGGLSGTNFAFRADFGLSAFMGIGLSYSNSILQNLSDVGEASRGVSEFGAEALYHVPWKNQFVDLGVAAGLGLSTYNYQSYETNYARSMISSVMYFAEARPRFYFSRKNRLGAFAYYRFTYYTGYGDASDKTTPRYEYDVFGRSHLFGGGLFYRLGRQRSVKQESN
jgi:hypothetical protein